MAHYQFEMIHPFDRYNGLVGRILSQVILLNANYTAASFICHSEYLNLHKEAYFDKLSATQRGSGFLPWVKFFVEGMCVVADQAIERIKRFTDIVSEDEKRLATLVPASKYIKPVYNYFRQNLISEIMPISDILGISYNTAAKAVKSLTEVNILTLEQKQSRHKVYCHSTLEYLKCKLFARAA
jgi:Fic family protein